MIDRIARPVAAALAALLLAVVVSACAPDAERALPPEPVGEGAEAVTGLMAAFNDHDPDRMREYWHDDVTWIEVSGEGASVITSSADQLHGELVAYFETFPSVRSSLENVSVNGDFVSALERPVWEEDGERKSQASFVVYEIAEGKVKRFWYFPPQT